MHVRGRRGTEAMSDLRKQERSAVSKEKSSDSSWGRAANIPCRLGGFSLSGRSGGGRERRISPLGSMKRGEGCWAGGSLRHVR